MSDAPEKIKYLVAEFAVSPKNKLTELRSVFIGDATEDEIDLIHRNADSLSGCANPIFFCCPIQDLTDLITEAKKADEIRKSYEDY